MKRPAAIFSGGPNRVLLLPWWNPTIIKQEATPRFIWYKEYDGRGLLLRRFERKTQWQMIWYWPKHRQPRAR